MIKAIIIFFGGELGKNFFSFNRSIFLDTSLAACIGGSMEGRQGKKLQKSCKIIPIWELAHPPRENTGSAHWHAMRVEFKHARKMENKVNYVHTTNLFF